MTFQSEAFAQALKEQRRVKGLTEKQASEEMQPSTLSESAIIYFEKRGVPQLDHYALCCQWLGVPMETFFK